MQKSLVLATTLMTCTALQANEHEDKKLAGKEHHADKGGPITAEKFVQKALACGEMEAQMGQLGQQQAQNAEVKTLAAAMAKDHAQANQKLQRIASTKSITQDKAEQSKHQKHMAKLKSQSGAEFDKEFVRMALTHHKKDIAAFEKAQTKLDDQELKTFISETLPKLKEHHRLAQAAARSVGVDEATITADIEADSDTAAGAAAGAESGELQQNNNNNSTDRPRSSLDGATESDNSGTINQNNPSLDAEARIGDRELNAEVDTDVDADGNKVFQKGDGKVLGLPTDKSDGKFLGIIPNPRADKDADADASIEADVDVDTDDDAVGNPATTESGTSKKDQ